MKKLFICVLSLLLGTFVFADDELLVGDINMSASVDQIGGASITIPIEVPAGINGMQPDLALVYNSHSGYGLAGWGWDLAGISAIQRTGKTYYHDGKLESVTYSETDNLMLDGERLLLKSGENLSVGSVYRTERESFNHIEMPKGGFNTFNVIDKDGITSRYTGCGFKTESHLYHEWRIKRKEDANGNYVLYKYTNFGGFVPYISTIEYTLRDDEYGEQSGDSFYQIHFYYETAPYKHHHYACGLSIVQNKLLSRIDIASNNEYLYSYELEYNTSSIVPKLVSVKKVADNGDYYAPTTIVWSSADTKAEVNTPLTVERKEEYLFGDFNGDGRIDLFSFDPESTNAIIHYNTTINGVVSFTAQEFTFPYKFKKLKIGDYNGDGRMDLIGIYLNNDKYCLTYLLSNGTTFTSTTDYVLCPNMVYAVGDFDGDGDDEFINQDDNKLYSYGKAAVSYPEVYLWYDTWVDEYGFHTFEKKTDNIVLDFNGDGRSDIFCKNSYDDEVSIMEYNTESQRFDPIVDGTVSEVLGVVDFEAERLHFGDFNGDGKTDIVYVFEQSNGTYLAHIYMYDGRSFIFDRSVWAYDYNLKIEDFNGDGLSDIAYFYPGSDGKWHLRTEINTGNSFVRSDKEGLNIVSEDLNVSSDIHFYDMYGVGLPDFICMDSKNHMISMQLYDSNPMLVEKVTDGLGNDYTFTYKCVTDNSVYTNIRIGGASVYPLVNSYYVVSDYTAPYTSLSYHYKNGRYHTKGKGFLGFEGLTVTDNLNNTITNTVNYITAKHLHNYPHTTSVTDLDGDTLSFHAYRYTIKELGGVHIFPYHSGYEHTDYATTLKETVVSLYDENGNLYSETKTRGDWKEVSEYQYVTKGSWCPNRISNSLTYNVYNGSTSPYRRTFYKYDSCGNLTRQTIDTLYTDTYRLAKQYEYDSFGNVIKETVSGSGQTRTKSYTYTPNGRFLLTATDEYGHITTYAYDTVMTCLLSVTTPVGKTSYTYDAFGRNIQTVQPDSVMMTRTLQYVSSVPGIKYKTTETVTNRPTVTTYYSSSGKPLFVERVVFNNKSVYTAYAYYPNGQEKYVSEPYFSTSISAAASQSFSADNATIYTYDDYNRLSHVAAPVGATVYDYNGLTMIVNAQSWTRTTKLNSSGFAEYEQIGKGAMPMRSSTTPSFDELYKKVSYTYYPTGQVKTATPDGGSPVTMEYDVQGNRTKLTDPDAGVITNTYNAFGQVLTRSQNIHGSTPVTTTYTYSSTSGKLSNEVTAGDTTVKISYRYNTTFKDKPSRISGNGTSSYLYDDYGNVKTHTRYYGGESTNLRTYRDKGLVTRHYMTDAGFNNVYYTYDTYGNMISEKFNTTVAWELLEENARGQVVRERKGGVVTTYTYDNCGRVTSIVAPGIVSLHYTYDGLGNVLTKTDAINNQSIEYTYDHLMRLVSWTVNNNSTGSITYDATTGNIISKSDLGESSEFVYDSSSKPHALRGVNNFAGDWGASDVSIDYTDFSKVKSIRQGNDSYNIVYGVDKERLCTQKTISGVTTTRYYAANHEVVVNSLGEETYIIYLCNGSIAIHDDATDTQTLYHGYYDAQGSLIALTDNSGNVIARYAYDPWGKRVAAGNWGYSPTYTPTLNIDRGYTMHEHLDEFGLINMNGRVYDPSVAQFLSPDPYIQDGGNWLNYNRYAYCYNNPTRYTDPSGEILGIVLTGLWDLTATLFNGGLNFNKKIRQDAWRKFDPTAPWSKTNRAVQISKGLIQTDSRRNGWGQFWQFTSRITWEILQTLVGYTVSHIRNIAGFADRVDYYGGATFVTNEYASNGDGFSIGSYINVNVEEDVIDRPFNEYVVYNPTYMHEYGHYRQSQILGFVYFVPAFHSGFQTWKNKGKKMEYNYWTGIPVSSDAWSETWANRLAAKYFGKYEGVDWERDYFKNGKNGRNLPLHIYYPLESFF